MTARTLGTLIIIVLFFGYLAAANVYVQTVYNRFGRAGPAVPLPLLQQIQQTTQTVMQILTIVVIAVIAVNMVIKSRKILGTIPFKELQRHLLLLGPTGAGKTTIAKQIIGMAIKKGVKVTILDWKAGAGGFINPADFGQVIPGRSRSLFNSYQGVSSYSKMAMF